jgi:hypothetical protein
MDNKLTPQNAEPSINLTLHGIEIHRSVEYENVSKHVAKAPFACQWQEILPSPISDDQT